MALKYILRYTSLTAQLDALFQKNFSFLQLVPLPKHFTHLDAGISCRTQENDAIYGAYFEHGRDIGDREVLAAIAAEAGLDAEEMRRALQGNAAQQQVEEEARWAQRQGITGVPFFVFNSRLALSGAQPPEALLRALRQVENQPTEGDDIG